jgi:poly(3-hydroxybutyrate) depolymerase
MARSWVKWVAGALVTAGCSAAGAPSERQAGGVVDAPRVEPSRSDPGAVTPPVVSDPGASVGSAGAGSAEPPGAGVAGMPGAAGMGGLQEGSGGTGAPGPTADEQDVTVADFACPGGTIAQGMNTIMVGTRVRSFYAEFPGDMSGSIGVVFSWHGYNDAGSDGDAAGWRNADEVDPNEDPANPVVVVTPFDVDYDIPIGLDWQFDQPTSATNVDLAFFEAMVGCLNAQYDLDDTRVYSYGFSAGSVMSSLLHSAYPKIVSAIVCVSGMWFNDPVQVDMIQLVPVAGTWPLLDAADGGAVLLTHGGPADVTVLGVANLENMAQAAFPFLKAHGRVVIDCPHGGGHVLHPELTTSHVMRFFAEHRGGQASPYLSGNLTGYPPGCTLRLP